MNRMRKMFVNVWIEPEFESASELVSVSGTVFEFEIEIESETAFGSASGTTEFEFGAEFESGTTAFGSGAEFESESLSESLSESEAGFVSEFESVTESWRTRRSIEMFRFRLKSLSPGKPCSAKKLLRYRMLKPVLYPEPEPALPLCFHCGFEWLMSGNLMTQAAEKRLFEPGRNSAVCLRKDRLLLQVL